MQAEADDDKEERVAAFRKDFEGRCTDLSKMLRKADRDVMRDAFSYMDTMGRAAELALGLTGHTGEGLTLAMEKVESHQFHSPLTRLHSVLVLRKLTDDTLAAGILLCSTYSKLIEIADVRNKP